jgi:hypothetical protein
MKIEILDNCVAGAFAGTMPFGETVGHMLDEGVEWYSANLLFGASTHYSADGSHHQSRWPGWQVPAIADRFDEAGVVAAIRASQAAEIKYPEFLQRIARAGVVYYTVHMQGRKAIYFGRHGDFHIELFPR